MATKNRQSTKPTTVTMRYEQVLVAHRALMLLAQMDLPRETAMHIRRLVRVVGPPAEDAQEERRKLLRLHAQLDERGQVVADEHGQVQFESDEKRSDYEEAHRELMELEADLEVRQLRASALPESVKPALLIALDDLLLDDLE